MRTKAVHNYKKWLGEDNDSLYEKAFGRWYKRAQERCMYDSEYAEIEERITTEHGLKTWDPDGWQRQSDIMNLLAPKPMWLKVWGRLHHNRTLHPKHIRNRIVCAHQRMKRGYSYQDLWNFDWYLSTLCEQAFRDLRDVCYGWPGDQYMTFEEWLEIHTKIADGFKAKREQHNIEYKSREQHDKEYQELEAKWLAGMELFTKWYGSFWD